MSKNADATCIIFDVGANTREYDKSKGITFYDEAKKCIEAIITQKIFNKPKDEVSLFFLGTKTTDNMLNTKLGGYENICQAFEMKPMDWDILKYVKNCIDPPSEDITADWMDAIVIALDYFTVVNTPSFDKKIFLFTTFTTDVNTDYVREVISGLKELNVELIVITKNVICDYDENEKPCINFSQSGEKDEKQKRSENLIEQIVMKTNGVMCSIDTADEKLSYIAKKQRIRRPWKCDLTIGTNISIKIEAYIYVRDEKELPPWTTHYRNLDSQVDASNNDASTSSVNGSNLKTVPVTSKIEIFYNDEIIDEVTAKEELIKGYLYGGEPVAFEEDSYDNGGKGLRFIGFTSIDTIHPQYYVGETIYAVVPQNSARSMKCFAALTKAMLNTKSAIIARYTYRQGTVPRLMALIPDENVMFMHELFYIDNFVDLQFPNLQTKLHTPSEEQYAFMDQFIDSMDLMNGNKMDVDEPGANSSEMFKRLLDPGSQYVYRAIAHRALYPNEPLLKMDDEIMALITPPKLGDAEKLKEHFPLKGAKLTGKKAFHQNMLKWEQEYSELNKPNFNPEEYSDLHEIGTIRPADDFNKLLDRGEPFNVLSKQIENVIINLVVKSLVAMDDKILKALIAYRETAKQKGPFKYNNWIPIFKEELKQREKISLWQSVISENLGLITEEESEMSLVKAEEAKEFYKYDDFNTKKLQPINNDDLEMDDALFDEI